MVWMAIRPLHAGHMCILYHARRKGSAPKGHLLFKPWIAWYNASRSDVKPAQAGLYSANAESLYHVRSPHMVWMAIRPFSATSMCILYPNPTHFTINTLRQSAQALPPKRTSSPGIPFDFTGQCKCHSQIQFPVIVFLIKGAG